MSHSATPALKITLVMISDRSLPEYFYSLPRYKLSRDSRNCSNNCSKLPGLWILTVVNWTAERRDAGVCGDWDSRKIKYDIQLQRKRVNMKCHRVIIKSQQNFNNGSWYLSPKCVAFKMQNTKEHNTFVTQDNTCLHCDWWINTCIRYLEVYTMQLDTVSSIMWSWNEYLSI